MPSDLPHREAVITHSARHLELIVETNQQFNLTRILNPREAAIKHVLDSVLPWRYFTESRHILDAGTGAGFPGIALALVLPGTHFTLAESTGKKARFVADTVAALGLANVTVENARAEELLRTLHPDTITGRALAPLDRACVLFGPAIRSGARALLYKGPDAEAEIAAALNAAQKFRFHLRIAARYDLPDSLGARTLVEMTR